MYWAILLTLSQYSHNFYKSIPIQTLLIINKGLILWERIKLLWWTISLQFLNIKILFYSIVLLNINCLLTLIWKWSLNKYLTPHNLLTLKNTPFIFLNTVKPLINKILNFLFKVFWPFILKILGSIDLLKKLMLILFTNTKIISFQLMTNLRFNCKIKLISLERMSLKNNKDKWCWLKNFIRLYKTINKCSNNSTRFNKKSELNSEWLSKTLNLLFYYSKTSNQISFNKPIKT